MQHRLLEIDMNALRSTKPCQSLQSHVVTNSLVEVPSNETNSPVAISQYLQIRHLVFSVLCFQTSSHFFVGGTAAPREDRFCCW
jgi:hypothetical protein